MIVIKKTLHPGSSSKAWSRPLFNPFQASRAWTLSFRPLLFVGQAICDFWVLGLEAFWHSAYAWLFFNTLLVALSVRPSQSYNFVLLLSLF
jgi:hypothetical protein